MLHRATRMVVPLLLALLAAGCGNGSSGSSDSAASTPSTSGSSAATMSPTEGRTTLPPWDPPSNASKYIQAAGLPPMTEERVDVHYHAHLDIFDDGRQVPVAPYIGIDGEKQRISPLHTHDTSGIVHIESPKEDKFTLGQLFTEWNVRLTADCVGGLCASSDKPLKVYVNGQPYDGDPRAIVFVKHQEIAIVYGTPPAKIPSSYHFDGA